MSARWTSGAPCHLFALRAFLHNRRMPARSSRTSTPLGALPHQIRGFLTHYGELVFVSRQQRPSGIMPFRRSAPAHGQPGLRQVHRMQPRGARCAGEWRCVPRGRRLSSPALNLPRLLLQAQRSSCASLMRAPRSLSASRGSTHCRSVAKVRRTVVSALAPSLLLRPSLYRSRPRLRRWSWRTLTGLTRKTESAPK